MEINKDMLIKYKLHIFTLMCLLCINVIFIYSRNYMFIYADELGYVAAAKLFAGKEYFNVTRATYYCYGYSIIISPIFRIFQDNIVQYKSIQCINLIFYISSYFLILNLLKKLKMLNKSTALAAFVPMVYPPFIARVYLALPEVFITFLLLISVIFLYNVINRGTYLDYTKFLFIICYLYSTHKRLIVVVIASFIVLILLGIKNKKFAQTVYSILFVFVGFKIIGIGDAYVNEYVYLGASGTNDLKDGMHFFAAILDFGHFLSTSFGKYVYLYVATTGVIILSLSVNMNKIYTKFREKDDEYILHLYTWLCFMGLFAITCLSMSKDILRFDHFFYGRYYDPVIPVIMIYFAYIVNSDISEGFLKKITKLSFVIIGLTILITAIVLKVDAEVLTLISDDLNITAMAAYKFIFGNIDNSEIMFRATILSSVAFGTLLILINKTRKSNKINMYMVCMMVVFFNIGVISAQNKELYIGTDTTLNNKAKQMEGVKTFIHNDLNIEEMLIYNNSFTYAFYQYQGFLDIRFKEYPTEDTEYMFVLNKDFSNYDNQFNLFQRCVYHDDLYEIIEISKNNYNTQAEITGISPEKSIANTMSITNIDYLTNENKYLILNEIIEYNFIFAGTETAPVVLVNETEVLLEQHIDDKYYFNIDNIDRIQSIKIINKEQSEFYLNGVYFSDSIEEQNVTNLNIYKYGTELDSEAIIKYSTFGFFADGWRSKESAMKVPLEVTSADDKNNLMIKFNLNGFGSNENIQKDQELSIYINGEYISTHNITENGNIEVFVDKQLVNRNVLNIDFKLDEAYKPKDYGMNTDNRELGIRIDSMIIEEIFAPKNYVLGTNLTLDELKHKGYAISGFYDDAWTMKDVTIQIPIKDTAAENLRLILDVNGFGENVDINKNQIMSCYVNDVYVGEYLLNETDIIEVGFTRTKDDDGIINIDLILDNVYRPVDYGMNSDSRELGAQIKNLTITENSGE